MDMCFSQDVGEIKKKEKNIDHHGPRQVPNILQSSGTSCFIIGSYLYIGLRWEEHWKL
jgi:hypothetical protein